MKPFDPTKPYCRRDGKPAKIVYIFKNGEYLVIYTTPVDEYEYYYKVNGEGKAMYVSCDGDLINIPEKIEGSSEYLLSCFSCGLRNNLRMFAQRGKDQNMVGWVCICDKCETPDAVKVSFTEGEGLSDD